MPGMGDLWAMMRDTLWEILPEIVGDRTAREAPPKEPHPSGSWLGRMPSGDALSGVRIATFGEAGPSHSAAVSPQATMPKLSTETIAGSAKEKEVPPQTFILGEGFPAVLAKLANRIQKGEFVDMTELLKDNIEAERR